MGERVSKSQNQFIGDEEKIPLTMGLLLKNHKRGRSSDTL